MGAGVGRDLYDALHDAASRGVHIRILQAPGFAGPAGGPPATQESDTLQAAFPDQIEIHSITMGDWYGESGIMHQKVWVFDGRDVYIGSANMDWKSIAQVKEIGVAVEGCAELAADVQRYFEAWWSFSALTASSVEVFDPLRAHRPSGPGVVRPRARRRPHRIAARRRHHDVRPGDARCSTTSTASRGRCS